MRIISQKYLEVSEFIHTFALPNINHMNELENIQNHIYNIRGQRVMLDFDLAHIYEVETKALNQAVKRNYKRFEGDEFMFQLTSEEWKIFTNLNPQDSDNGDILDSFSEDYNLRSQIVTSRFSNKWGGNRRPPYAFTEINMTGASPSRHQQIAFHDSLQLPLLSVHLFFFCHSFFVFVFCFRLLLVNHCTKVLIFFDSYYLRIHYARYYGWVKAFK